MNFLPVNAFSYVQRFACLAERCEDTCCTDWRIGLDPRSVDLYLQHIELERLIVKDEGGYTMRNAQGGCVALQGGRCKIHSEYGEQALSNTCANYPRMFRSINGTLQKSASMSCPEITRLCLFGDRPFDIEIGTQDDYYLSGVSDQTFPGLQVNQWQSIVGQLLAVAATPERSVGEVLLRLQALAERFTALPVAEWGAMLDETPDPLGDRPSRHFAEQPAFESFAVDPILQVLGDVLSAPVIPQSLQQRLLDGITVTAADAELSSLALQSRYRELYQGVTQARLDEILKRFIGAEMTRVGFPFVSSASAGRDYGASVAEWAATLAIRTLALRYLLVLHGDPVTGAAPDDVQIVDVVHRFCRSANHHAATPAEHALRKVISERGSAYLLALIEQL